MRHSFFPTLSEDLLTRPDSPLYNLSRDLDRLTTQITRAEALVPPSRVADLHQLLSEMQAFSTPITLVGQVKAGKTALTNVLVGRPGLLPSDVNPWTSVVTSMHVNGSRPGNVAARFSFFDRAEWDNLVLGGGRLGQMAQRAGAAQELTQIRLQIAQMQEKSQARLGRNYELLLGNQHRYDHFDAALIERYVCLGDEDDEGEAGSGKQGRFADITRSAELFLRVPAYPLALTLQNTPGVNDPLLMREQITLRCLGDAALCVMVLSAAQALSRVDLALIQILAAMEGRRVIIFVNRIDELSHPASQIDEIRSSLTATLARHGIGTVEAILFGAARWAEAALKDAVADLPPASLQALRDLAVLHPGVESPLSPAEVWQLSGVAALQDAIAKAIAAGSGARLREDVTRRLGNVLTGALAQYAARSKAVPAVFTPDQLARRLDQLATGLVRHLDGDMQAMLAALETRIAQGSRDFVQATVEKLVAQAREGGVPGRESCDPMILRMRLRAGYILFATDLRGLFSTLAASLSQALAELFGQMLNAAPEDMRLSPLQPPDLPMPMAIGRSILIALDRPWWKSWIADRLSTQALARDYHAVVEAEVGAICQEVVAAAQEALIGAKTTLQAFLNAQAAVAHDVTAGGQAALAQIGNLTTQIAAIKALRHELAAPTREAALVLLPENVVVLRHAI